MKVKATKPGYIYGIYRREGDVFDLVDVDQNDKHFSAENLFSSAWMKKLDVAQKVKVDEPKVDEPKVEHKPKLSLKK
jgi:hypothetical protein